MTELTIFQISLADFALFLTGMFFLVRKPARQFFHDRREALRTELQATADKVRAARRRHGASLSAHNALDTVLRQHRERWTAQADIEVAEIRRNAQTQAQRIIEAAERQSREVFVRMGQTVGRRIIEGAIDDVRRRVQQELTESGRKSVVEAGLSHLTDPSARDTLTRGRSA